MVIWQNECIMPKVRFEIFPAAHLVLEYICQVFWGKSCITSADEKEEMSSSKVVVGS